VGQDDSKELIVIIVVTSTVPATEERKRAGAFLAAILPFVEITLLIVDMMKLVELLMR
jgi:hypothetical protein